MKVLLGSQSVWEIVEVYHKPQEEYILSQIKQYVLETRGIKINKISPSSINI